MKLLKNKIFLYFILLNLIYSFENFMFYMCSKIYFVNNYYYLKYVNDINMGDFYWNFILVLFKYVFFLYYLSNEIFLNIIKGIIKFFFVLKLLFFKKVRI